MKNCLRSSVISKKKGRTDIDIDLVVLAICERLKIKSSDILRKKVVSDIRKYRHNKINVKKACVENTELINANDYEKVENLDPVENRLSSLARKCNVIVLLKYFVLQIFIDDESSLEENSLTVNQLLGYLLYRINYSSNKKLSNLGFSLYSNNHTETNNFTTRDAITFMHDLTLSKEQVRVLKQYLKEKNVFFPNTNDLLEARKKLRPVLKPILNDNGVTVDYVDLTVMTTKSIINMCNENKALDNNSRLNMFYKEGDTAGSQSTWNSKSMITASHHMFQYSLVLLRLEIEGTVVWKNPAPNSPSSTRPLFLIRGHKDDEVLLDAVVPQTDIPRNFLNASVMNIEAANKMVYSVQHAITDSMKDLLSLRKNYLD